MTPDRRTAPGVGTVGVAVAAEDWAHEFFVSRTGRPQPEFHARAPAPVRGRPGRVAGVVSAVGRGCGPGGPPLVVRGRHRGGASAGGCGGTGRGRGSTAVRA